MQPSTNYSPNQSTAVLLVGSPGSGKTTLALQFPRPYVFDADNNLAGPSRYLAKENKPPFMFDIGTVNPDGTEVKPFDRWGHMRKCLSQAAESDQVDTIIVDSMSAVQEFIKNDIFRQRVPSPGSRVPLVTEATLDRANLTEPEWGIFARYLSTLVTSLRSTNKIVVFTCHQETRQNDQGMWQSTISLQGMMRFKFAGMFSDCIGLSVKVQGNPPNEKIVRTYRTLPTSDIDERGLKSSFDLPPVFNDPQLLLEQLK